ncbi:hypothetical protein BDQ17DRAFT_1367326 [Cyathus striatus]|nr:hypothetical protein BDQ17DRAFT_1367326 [Cyathus striatus]
MSHNEERLVREEVWDAVDGLFRIDILDTLLPHLHTSNTQLHTHILHLFASTTRSTTRCTALTSWTPPSEHAKEVRLREGCEVAPLGPGWVARELIGIIRGGGVSRSVGPGKGGVNESVPEAALSPPAAICRDSPGVLSGLVKRDRERYVHLGSVLGYARGRRVGVQLAGYL